MNEKTAVAADPDRATLRKASLRIAVRITLACAVMVLCLLAGAAVYLMNQLAYLDYKDLLKALVIVGAAGIVLAGVIGWLSARSAIRPLGEAMALQRRFVQDASHELRTPLAILDARIQLAQRDAPPDSKPGQALARIRDDTSTLTAIVNELLLAATGSAAESPTEPVDVAEVTASVADSLRQIAHEAGVGLKVTSGDRALARIDPNSLRRAILALVDNALAHTPPGGTIALVTARTPRSAVITVTDTGNGITGVERDRIFERFVRTPRLDGAPGHRSFGIGLALVRDVVTRAGGTVEIAGTGPQGTTMKISLPLTSD
ncbi:HAMP domain-containing sensor histidine kinase [Pseudarthrobacter sp. AB1]|uniref:sensor histidine kinase n=1 Tax=Pseudarthrobacter sp. AB1 TaxID=2138309 RepID=UPI00186B97E8|nr:HAMP domain-containing sensor histidine kinase [Pseudarthrobacter sp. AB1]MBE4718400.1 sensor histidine kinase [Pseudarthrobacter sp. AB1]